MDAEHAALVTKQQEIKTMLGEQSTPTAEPTKTPQDERPEFWDNKVREESLNYEKDVTPKRSWTVKVRTETKTPEKPGGLLSWFRRGGKRTRRKRVKGTRKITFS